MTPDEARIVENLVQTLQWYASHLANSQKPGWERDGAIRTLKRDGGERARQAIASVKDTANGR